MTRRALVLGILVAASCSSSKPAPPAAAGLTPVEIGYSRLRISLPVFVAQEEGLFRKHGLDAKLVMYDTAQPMAQALVEGRVAVAGYTALPITYLGMHRSGTKLVFVTALVEDSGHRISYLLKRKGDPAIRAVADLRGKRIGILPTIAYKAWLDAILEAHGVGRGEVTIQQIEPALQGGTLASGGVDALYTNDPAATAAIAGGAAELITGEIETPKVLGDPFLFGSFNVTQAWADAHPAELAKLTAALDEAIELIRRDPARAKRAMRRYLPEAFRAHVDLYPDARYLTSSETRPEAFAEIAAQYQKMGILPGPVDLAGLVHTTAKGP